MSKKTLIFLINGFICLSVLLSACGGITPQSIRATTGPGAAEQEILLTQDALKVTMDALSLQQTLDVAMRETQSALDAAKANEALTQTASVPASTATSDLIDIPVSSPTSETTALPSEMPTLIPTGESLTLVTATATSTEGTFTLTNCNEGNKKITFQISQPSGFYKEMNVNGGACQTIRLARGVYDYLLLPCRKRGQFQMNHPVQWYWYCR